MQRKRNGKTVWSGISNQQKVQEQCGKFYSLQLHLIELQVCRSNLKVTIKMSITQVYATTTMSNKEELENFYDDLQTTMSRDKSQFMIIMGDFNGNVGEGNEGAYKWRFGHGIRNERGDEIINFSTVHDLKNINSHFKKTEDRNNASIILLHKRRNAKYFTNYRPIRLLNCSKNLFTRIISDRRSIPLDDNQPCEQARFRKKKIIQL